LLNGKIAFFFNNWEEDHGYLPASLLIAKQLNPGETARASGVFIFTNQRK